MAKIGRKGGQIGGKRRLKTMTKEQRRKVAAKAAKTRWANHVKSIPNCRVLDNPMKVHVWFY